MQISGAASKASILSDATKSRLLNGETTFEQLANGLDGQLVIAKTVASGSKVAWARWVAAKQESELTGSLNHLIDLIREGLAYVGVEIVP